MQRSFIWVIACFLILILSGGQALVAQNQPTPIERALADMAWSSYTGNPELVISDYDLTELPPEIGLLTHLEVLEIAGNRIETLPPEIGQLVNLKELRVHEELTTLPPEIGQLQNLEILKLEGNRLLSLPPEIGSLSSLRELYLANESCDARWNGVEQLPPEIGQLQALEILDVGYNNLSALPSEIGQLTALQRLDVSGNNLGAIPADIGQTALTHLLLGNRHCYDRVINGTNHFVTLPTEVGQLTNLQELSIPLTGLESIPASIGSLNNLQTLDLSGNALTQFPHEITQISSLLVLNLGNAVEMQRQGAANYTFHKIGNNSIPTLPPEIGGLVNLSVLDLTFNELSELPQELGNLTNLESLLLSFNNITTLPTFIGQLQNLVRLNLGGNRLSTLPPEIGQLRQLTDLWLNDNNLFTLPPEIRGLRSLEYLDLRNNELTALPDDLMWLVNLTTIDFNGNIALNNIYEIDSSFDEFYNGEPIRDYLMESYMLSSPVDSLFRNPDANQQQYLEEIPLDTTTLYPFDVELDTEMVTRWGFGFMLGAGWEEIGEQWINREYDYRLTYSIQGTNPEMDWTPQGMLRTTTDGFTPVTFTPIQTVDFDGRTIYYQYDNRDGPTIRAAIELDSGEIVTFELQSVQTPIYPATWHFLKIVASAHLVPME